MSAPQPHYVCELLSVTFNFSPVVDNETIAACKISGVKRLNALIHGGLFSLWSWLWWRRYEEEENNNSNNNNNNNDPPNNVSVLHVSRDSQIYLNIGALQRGVYDIKRASLSVIDLYIVENFVAVIRYQCLHI